MTTIGWFGRSIVGAFVGALLITMAVLFSIFTATGRMGLPGGVGCIGAARTFSYARVSNVGYRAGGPFGCGSGDCIFILRHNNT